MERLRQRLPLFALVALGAATLVACLAMHITPADVMASARHLSPWAAAHPMLGAMGFVALVTISVASALPGSIIVDIAGGALFGIGLAFPLALIGEVLGATILYLAGCRAFAVAPTGAATQYARIQALADRMRSGYQRNPWWYTLSIRSIPMLPTGAMSLVLAWLHCPLRIFLFATALGEAVMLSFETGLGSGLSTAFKHGFSLAAMAHPGILIPLLGLVILLSVPVCARWLRLTRPAR